MNAFPYRGPAHNFPTPPSIARSRQPVPELLLSERECELNELERAFSANGGMASTDEITMMLRARTDQPISVLARWIVSRKVVSVKSHSGTMLPLFQFSRCDMELRPRVVHLLEELEPVLTDWEVALWFARPNAWLGNAAPVQAIEVDARAVHDAARAERYVSRG